MCDEIRIRDIDKFELTVRPRNTAHPTVPNPDDILEIILDTEPDEDSEGDEITFWLPMSEAEDVALYIIQKVREYKYKQLTEDEVIS